MDRKKVPSKAPKKKVSHLDDPAFIGVRLKGLASLVDAAANSTGHMERLDTPALLFLSTELEEMAERLSRS